VWLRQNGPLLRLLPGTTLEIVGLRFSGAETNRLIETRLKLHEGRILAAVAGLAPGSLYEVETPRGVYRARGTAFVVSAEGWLLVIDGQVERQGASGSSLARAGEVLDADSASAKPAPPELVAEHKIDLASLLGQP
jgi:hypothetical protein